MRTIKNVVNDLKFHVELPNSPEKYRILKLFDEILEIHKAEKEQIIEKMINAYDDAHIKSKTINTPRETLIRWDGHKEGISEAIEIVKRGGK